VQHVVDARDRTDTLGRIVSADQRDFSFSTTPALWARSNPVIGRCWEPTGTISGQRDRQDGVNLTARSTARDAYTSGLLGARRTHCSHRVRQGKYVRTWHRVGVVSVRAALLPRPSVFLAMPRRSVENRSRQQPYPRCRTVKGLTRDCHMNFQGALIQPIVL